MIPALLKTDVVKYLRELSFAILVHIGTFINRVKGWFASIRERI